MHAPLFSMLFCIPSHTPMENSVSVYTARWNTSNRYIDPVSEGKHVIWLLRIAGYMNRCDCLERKFLKYARQKEKSPFHSLTDLDSEVKNMLISDNNARAALMRSGDVDTPENPVKPIILDNSTHWLTQKYTCTHLPQSS